MFYAWFGIAHFMAGKPKESYEYLCKGLDLGEKVDNQKVIGYASTWLTWACAELGLFDEGIGYGKRAQKISGSFPSDQYLFFKSLAGLCINSYYKGNTPKVFEGAKRLLEYGEGNANSRSKVFGHFTNAFGHFLTGDIEASRKCSEKAVEVALDPLYAVFPKLALGIAYFFSGRPQEAGDAFQSAIDFSEKRGYGQMSATCQYFSAATLIAKGHMQQGANLLERARKTLIKNHRKTQYATSEYILAEINSQIATGATPSFSFMAKNIGYLLKNAPFAKKKTEEHFIKAIELFQNIGATGVLGQVYLGFGLFYKASRKTRQARECISGAIKIFEETEAEVFLKQAKEELASLS